MTRGKVYGARIMVGNLRGSLTKTGLLARMARSTLVGLRPRKIAERNSTSDLSR